MNWKKHKKLLLQNPDFRKALMYVEPELQVAKAVIEARIKSGISQQELADRLHTKQSVISRVENARTSPSLTFLKRMASALQVPLTLVIRP